MWRRRNKHVEESEELRRARAEKERADRQLEHVRRNGEEVDRVSGAVTAYIVRNGFGESINRTFTRRAAT
ncbi:DUF7620 family protein [Nocardia sp. CA-290969]